MKITNESCIFTSTGTARLLFPHNGDLKLYDAASGKIYRNGKDYLIDADGITIRRTAGSSIPLFTDLYPENAVYYPASNANAVSGGPDGKNIRFDAELYFAGQQFSAGYTTVQEWPEDLFRISPFARPEKRFQRITTTGDSITEGYNASAYIGGAPYCKQYAALVADQLGATLTNLGKNGAPVKYLREIMTKIIDSDPDLLTIAFGMNDLAKLSPEEYISEIKSAVEIIRKSCPQTTIAVVSAMSGNPEWEYTPAGKSKAFAEALAVWADQEQLVLADVYQVWQFVLAQKGFFALTGNGVNHPNDFGHTLYAKTILSALGHPVDQSQRLNAAF